MAYLPAYRLKLYREFKALGAHDYFGVVRYFERYEEAIQSLDFEEYFDCLFCYTEALYETGNYGKHVVMCDHLLELIIRENIVNWGGKDLYRSLLYRKSASLYYQLKVDDSAHILRELIKMQPDDKLPPVFLRRCLLFKRPKWLVRVRAVTVLLVLMAVLTIGTELFVVRPFYTTYFDWSLWAHNTFLISAILLLAAGEMVHFLICYRKVKHFTHEMAIRKRGKALLES